MKNRTTHINDTSELDQINAELSELINGSNFNQGMPTAVYSRNHKIERTRRSDLVRQRKKQIRRRKERRGIPIALILLFFLILALGGGIFGAYTLFQTGKRDMLAHEAVDGIEIAAPEEAIVEEHGKRITYQGKIYQRNENVISILALGVDRLESDWENNTIGENGQADTIVLAALDTETGNLNLINLSRDSMVDVDLYDEEGKYVGIENMQLCLAYAYGNGKETSCENVKKSVSRLLYGMPVDAYAAINIPAISVLNDAVGGVEVTVLEDFSARDAALVKGEKVLLNGKQAQMYVRSRESGEDGPIDANNVRMDRQKQYLISFIHKTLSQVKSDPSVVLSLYDVAKAYMVTDIDLAKTIYLASLAVQGEFNEKNLRTVPGTVTMGEKYAEYHVDDEALYQIILDVFYKEL